eukprot:4058353-Lingulodinium_polyedra.AAC.1
MPMGVGDPTRAARRRPTEDGGQQIRAPQREALPRPLVDGEDAHGSHARLLGNGHRTTANKTKRGQTPTVPALLRQAGAAHWAKTHPCTGANSAWGRAR